MEDSVPGFRICCDGDRKHFVFDEGLTADDFAAFLAVMMRTGTEFSVYDPKYPSPSDPGAYLSYSPKDGVWRMTLGNHGWSGGIYVIRREIVVRQLSSLYASGQLARLDLDDVCFFKHYAPETAERNSIINQLIEEIHSVST